MGFLLESTPVSELPLLVSFEAKSLGDVKFKLASLRMEQLGYAIAKFANDGFALLRGDRMFANQRAETQEMSIDRPKDASQEQQPLQQPQQQDSLRTSLGTSLLPAHLLLGPDEDREPVFPAVV
jgi:hypothetical protein